MEIQQRIDNLTDNEALTYYEGFCRELLSKSRMNMMQIVEEAKLNLHDEDEITALLSVEPDKLEESIVKGKELIDLARTSLKTWANEPQTSPLVEEFLNKPQPQKMAAGMIVSILLVMASSLILTSTKIKFEDGKLKEFSFDTHNISDNAVNMVKAILGSIPESIKKLLPDFATH